MSEPTWWHDQEQVSTSLRLDSPLNTDLIQLFDVSAIRHPRRRLRQSILAALISIRLGPRRRSTGVLGFGGRLDASVAEESSSEGVEA
jgi:hypothetical protein